MQIKLNKEIRDYTESIFFGLSTRQFLFSCLACGVACVIYLKLNKALGTELTSWLCIIAAMPFAALGFVTFQGQTFEHLVFTAICSFLLSHRELVDVPYNLYYELTKDIIADKQKAACKKDKALYKQLKQEQKEEKRNAKNLAKLSETEQR